MKTRRVVSWQLMLATAGISFVLALLVAPVELLAGDIDAVGGYKFKIYEEDPPGDNPSGSALQSGEGATQARSVAGVANSGSPVADEGIAARAHISHLMRWLQFFALRR